MQKSSVNKVILVGHIGNKPEGRYTPSGISTATFSLATNESWIDSDKEKKEHTEWHNIIAWNKLAEFAKEYFPLELFCQVGKDGEHNYKKQDNLLKSFVDIESHSLKKASKKKTKTKKKKRKSKKRKKKKSKGKKRKKI